MRSRYLCRLVLLTAATAAFQPAAAAAASTGESSSSSCTTSDSSELGSDPPSSPTYSISEHFPEVGFTQSLSTIQPPTEPLYSHRSKYQNIEIFSSAHYGKILILDGVVQLTERDADSYNEMMAHVPMMEHVDPRKVLVIGGGDGYVVSEVLKHSSVEQVDHIDLDVDVIETCKRFFPWGRGAWSDPRVILHISDGSSFIQSSPSDYYDVIVQDSSDPFSFGEDGEVVELPSGVLYTERHFEQIYRILKPGGLFNFQAETIHLPSDLEGVKEWRAQALNVGFASARYGSLYISSYPLGQIGFLLCRKAVVTTTPERKKGTTKSVQERFEEMQSEGRGTTYYWPRLQTSCFDLPLWVHKKIYGANVASNGGRVGGHASDELL